MNPLDELKEICDEKITETICRNYCFPLLLSDEYVRDTMERIDSRHGKKKKGISKELAVLIQEVLSNGKDQSQQS